LTDPIWHPICAVDELLEGKMRAQQINGRDIVVCRTRDGFFALDNICSHAYARMDEGRLRGARLICPLHGASFDVRTGAVLGAPATQPLATHRVQITNGLVEVALSS
jgi:nitrite reductase/ring-hydroxylating ferredoxin subunit